jgi:flagellar motor switch protein FliG
MVEGVKALTGRRKAAILLVTLGTQSAAEVFKHLEQDTIEKLTVEMSRTQDIDPHEAEEVQREALETAYARGYVTVGGIAYAREVLEKAYGERRASEILTRLATMIEMTPFEFLRGTPPDQILAFLRGEHPQTVALVLANLPTAGNAAKVMQLMSAEEQADVAVRIAVMNKTSPEIVKDVANVVREKLQMVFQAEYAAAGGVQALADILNFSDRATERNILDRLGRADEELAHEVRSLLFTFEDIFGLDDRAIQLVLKEVDSKDLALALRGASEDVTGRILSNMSTRGSEMLREEMEFMPPQRLRAIEAAQSKVVAAVRRLEDAGEIFIARGSGTEQEQLVA